MKISMKFTSNILTGFEQFMIDCLYLVTNDGTLYGVELAKQATYSETDNSYIIEEDSIKISKIDELSEEEILVEEFVKDISKIDEIPIDFIDFKNYEKYKGKTINFTLKSLCFDNCSIPEPIIENFKDFKIA